MAGPKNNFEFWLQRLNQEDMPIFGRTVQEVISVSENKDSSMSELVRVVLKDASMTAKILKLANTAFYNPSNRSISTVSRAIMLMGFDTVRAITLTIALVESVVHAGNRRFLLSELARSLHAATQARSICRDMGDESAEEVFVATLLTNVGELAFWCFAKEEGEALMSEMKRGLSKEEAEMRVLGFPLHKLTEQLVSDWQLTSILQNTADPERKAQKRCQVIRACRDLAEAAEHGWQSTLLDQSIQKLALLSEMPKDEIIVSVFNNAREAARISKTYGVRDVADVIPAPPVAQAEKNGGAETETETETEGDVGREGVDLPRYNPELQLHVLRDMHALIQEKPDFNLLIEMALEGIYRGIGMDRVLFALISSDRQHLKARYALGADRDKLLESFRFNLVTKRPNIFKKVIDSLQSSWAGGPGRFAGEAPSEEIAALLGGGAFFLAPITVGRRSIGVFYADRLVSSRELDQQSFQNFEFFAQQTCFGLERIVRP